MGGREMARVARLGRWREKRFGGRSGATFVAVVAAAAMFLGLAATSSADPGRPGLKEATQAVYPEEGQGVGGFVGGGGEPGGDAGGLPGEAAQPVANEGTGLPFTGLSAPLVLLAGLITLAVGLTLRVTASASRRSTDTSGGR
jgi:hypothetical protein